MTDSFIRIIQLICVAGIGTCSLLILIIVCNLDREDDQ